MLFGVFVGVMYPFLKLYKKIMEFITTKPKMLNYPVLATYIHTNFLQKSCLLFIGDHINLKNDSCEVALRNIHFSVFLCSVIEIFYYAPHVTCLLVGVSIRPNV